MADDVLILQAQTRTGGTKTDARALRREGKIPATIYGSKKPPVSIAIARQDITRVYNSGRIMATLLDIEIDGTKDRVITRDLQLHPVKDIILHADFLRLGKGTKIAVEVPVQFLNEETCPGLKVGGVLNVVRFTVELLCPADAIPEFIELDLAEAEIGTSLHISEVNMPEGVVPTITDRDFTIATIAAPSELDEPEEEKPSEEAEEGEEGAEEEAAAEEGSEEKAETQEKDG